MSASISHKQNNWKERLKALRGAVLSVRPDSVWTTRQSIKTALENVTLSINEDLNALKQDAKFVFSTKAEIEDLTEQNIELIRRWHLQGNGPSLAAMCIFTIEQMQLNISPDLLGAVLIAGVLGEVENDLPYHSNMHYRKVLLQTMRMANIHNDIYKGTARVFDDNQIVILMLCACIHDLGHDGKGNTIKGLFKQGRLEERSFELALPYFNIAGIKDEAMLNAIKVMLLCTDVTPMNDPANPVGQMKAAYRFHYLGDKKRTEALNLDKNIAVLQKDAELTAMALILHEADISTSAGLNYYVTKYETSLYRQELEADDASPQFVLDFLDVICQRQMLSDAAQKLYASNMARIYALAEKDFKDGNYPFPKPRHSDFMLMHNTWCDNAENSKIIN